MPHILTMPKLSPTMQDGTIAKWHKKIGDKIEPGDLLIDVATDKASVEYNALDAGYLRKILVEEGSSCQINAPIAITSDTIGENIDSFVLDLTKPKEEIKSKKPETPKAETASQLTKTSIPSPASTITFSPEPPLNSYEFNFPTDLVPKRIPASPLAKKIAKEKGIDLSSVKGTGPGGRITSEDLNLAQKDLIVSFGKREQPSITPGSYEEISLSPMRKVIAERLQGAKNSIPHIYVRQEINAEALCICRDHLKEGQIKITINDFIIRACALALREHPVANSGFNSATQSIILFKTIDISVAVSIDGGLITPIIRHADFKNLGEISAEIKDLAIKAKTGKLKPEEYKGGSFTLSTLGKFGVTDFCAIINPPQALILSVGAIEEKPIVKNGQIVVGKTMNIIASADHRVLDGSDVALWLKTVQKYLENPSLLLI